MEYNKFIRNYEEDILDIKKIIRKNLKDNNSKVMNLMSKLPAEEGKFIRSIFVLIGGSFGKIERQRLKGVAAAVELLHLATLVHDDIVDDTDLRRGKKTIHKIYNTKSGLFAGDYLFSQAYVLFSKNCSSDSITEVSETIKFICRSEIYQYFSLYSCDCTIRDYLRKINGKCASMFSLSLSIGAYESMADIHTVKKLKDIGYNAGMAFQLLDDLLDITSTTELLGKPSGNDIKQGVYNMPIIYELKKGNQELLKLIRENNTDKAIDLLRDSEGVKKSREVAEKYTNKALKLIDELPNVGEKTNLKLIVERMLSRNY